MESLATQYFSEKSTHHSYLPYYEMLFDSRRYQIKTVLYVTIHLDQSIHIFDAYFSQAKIVGSFLTNHTPRFTSGKIVLETENPFTTTFQEAYQEEFDVIIYDGPVDLESLKLVAGTFPSLLKKTGILILESIANTLWLGELKAAFPKNLREYVTIVDRRKIKYRTDDILIVLAPGRTVSINYVAVGNMKPPPHKVVRNTRRISTIACKNQSTMPAFKDYPTLFHKYTLNLARPNNPIYEIIQDRLTPGPYLCHFHIYNLEFLPEFETFLDLILTRMNVILTYSIGNVTSLLGKSITLLKVPNQGYDVGAKMCAIDYLYRQNYTYDYLLFLHSKSDPVRRRAYLDPFVKSKARLDLICTLMEMKKTNLLGMFPDVLWYNHAGHKNYTDYDVYLYNEQYWQEILQYLDCPNQDRFFAEGNCMILHTSVIDRIFKSRIHIWYNLLNSGNSFDWNWFRIFYPEYKSRSMPECYQIYQAQQLYGNNNSVKNTPRSIPDGMMEHVFERIWINVIKSLRGNYLILNADNIMDRHQIQLNAIYFPQFHSIPENNKFWGKGFTEWTLLYPYPAQIEVDQTTYPILKPHSDLGYYNLSKVGPVHKQIRTARKYGIHGFIIYHYWFKNNHKILYKPLEYFLSPAITFPFAISWANETWSKRWDGSNNEILLSQEYGAELDYRTHIRYLIPFFQRPNYIRTKAGECLLYIYNFDHLAPVYADMLRVWGEELDRVQLQIKIVITENSVRQNHNLNVMGTQDFIFEPMYSTNYVQREKIDRSAFIRDAIVTFENFDFDYYRQLYPDIEMAFDRDNMKIFQHFQTHGVVENRSFKYGDTIVPATYIYDYRRIIQQYKDQAYVTDGKHLGLPLYWNNSVRRVGIPFLLVSNFDMAALREMLNVLVATILLRSINTWNTIPQTDNIINVNAWNEWNEQAILEPDNVHGYATLETIQSVISNL